MKSQPKKIQKLKLFILSTALLCSVSSFSQEISPAGVNIGSIQETVYFSSVRTLVPNKDWELLFPESNAMAYYQLNLPFASMPDFDIDELKLIRKANKHHRTIMRAQGRDKCEFLLEECFEIFGEIQYPAKVGKQLIFEWNVSENFAGQNVVYKLENKKQCTITMQVNQ